MCAPRRGSRARTPDPGIREALLAAALLRRAAGGSIFRAGGGGRATRASRRLPQAFAPSPASCGGPSEGKGQPTASSSCGRVASRRICRHCLRARVHPTRQPRGFSGSSPAYSRTHCGGAAEGQSGCSREVGPRFKNGRLEPRSSAGSAARCPPEARRAETRRPPELPTTNGVGDSVRLRR